MVPVNDQACCVSSSGAPSVPGERPGYVLWHFVDGFLNTPAGEVPRVKTEMREKVKIVDLDSCMECGACALNCSAEAITVTPGVGCASYI